MASPSSSGSRSAHPGYQSRSPTHCSACPHPAPWAATAGHSLFSSSPRPVSASPGPRPPGAPASSCEAPLQDQELHVHVPISSFQLSLHLPVGTDEDKDSGKLGGALRQWLPTPVFLSEEFHTQGSLVGCSPGGRRVRHDQVTKPSKHNGAGQGGVLPGVDIQRSTSRSGPVRSAVAVHPLLIFSPPTTLSETREGSWLLPTLSCQQEPSSGRLTPHLFILLGRIQVSSGPLVGGCPYIPTRSRHSAT